MMAKETGRRPRRWKQLDLQAAPGTRGGIRRGAGRPRGRKTVERVPRPRLSGREALHVTMRLRAGLPTLRRHQMYSTLRACFRRGKDRFGFRLVHYSVQSNHLHLICESEGTRSLSRGMQGLTVRIARGINRFVGRRGKVFNDRYHLRVLDSPRQVRNALIYVLRNAVHHGVAPAGPFFDVYSSAMYFDGWEPHLALPLIDDDERTALAPRVWLLTTGWRRHGLIGFDEVPAAAG